MKKAMKRVTTLAWIIMVLGITGITANAGTWEKNAVGYWYDNGGGAFSVNTWKLIDGNNDGTAECYYFDAAGYMLSNANTPDGYAVNESGAWAVNGVVQTQGTQTQLNDGTKEANTALGYNSDGINNIAIDLIHSTRAEANAKYGPEIASEYSAIPSLKYPNIPFGVGWSIKQNHEAGYQADPSNMDNYYILAVSCKKRTDMVNFLTEADNDIPTEELIKLLRARGYDAKGYDAYCYITFGEYQVQFYFNGNTLLKGPTY